jgi:putative tricarboxylic transport membrane protein
MTSWLRRPWWVGVAIIAMGSVWLYGASTLSQSSSISGVGPGIFVTLIGVALIVCGVVLVFQMSRAVNVPAAPAEDGAEKTPFQAVPFVTALVAVASPMWLMTSVGFPLTAALIFAAVTRAFGSRRILFDLAVGALLSSTSWFVFRWLGVELGSFLPLLRV